MVFQAFQPYLSQRFKLAALVGALVKKKEGSLTAKANADWNDPSFELWVQSNWATLIDGQTTFHCKLHVKWGIDISDAGHLLLVLGLSWWGDQIIIATVAQMKMGM
jgi:hypothetical protein